jgi:tetratricopeptide (TPR) repeat protein
VLARSEAVTLFVERARAAAPDFELTVDNATTVGEICVRLDGLPLALELAAARIGLLSPKAILERLEERLKLLKGGRRDAPARQQTLSATLDWSYDLLNEAERKLFAGLGVFAGGFTVDAAVAVCEADLDALGALVDRSLIRREAERLSMLETIRAYAVERLASSPHGEMLRDRHAKHFLGVAADALRARFEREAEVAEELEREHDNLRAVLDRFEEVDPERCLKLAGMLGWFWHVHSHLAEGRRRLADALARTSGRTEDRARALAAAGALAGYQGLVGEARPLVDEAIEIWRDLRREQEIALALFDLGWAYFFAGDDASARDCMERSFEIQRELGNPLLVNRAQLGLLQILVSQGELDDVPKMGEEAIDLSRALGDAWAEHFAHHFLADCALIEGDCRAAADRYALSLEAAARSGDRIETCYELQGLAMAFAGLGQSERALTIAAAADKHLQALGHVMSIKFWQALLDRYVGKAREDAGQTDADRAWAAGRQLTLDEAIELASSLHGRPDSSTVFESVRPEGFEPPTF